MGEHTGHNCYCNKGPHGEEDPMSASFREDRPRTFTVVELPGSRYALKSGGFEVASFSHDEVEVKLAAWVRGEEV